MQENARPVQLMLMLAKNVENKKHIYTVSELTRKIRTVLEGTFPAVWIEGEISNFIHHTSGHMYFSLKDDQSVLSAVLFKNVNKDLKFELKSGLQVICFGRISLYGKRGQYQLYVDKIEPKGIGALQMAFEQLKEKLRQEGLFSPARKKPIPYLPTRIGVVTSPTGAAIRDILNVTHRRFSNVEIIVNPVKVQGKGAKEEIASAIELFNKLMNVDVMIVGRGGGSIEDLWPFNEEITARAIANSKIPIISAVGHEVDWTISDFVADFRAPTPSAAAELIIPRKEELETRINNALQRLKNSLSGVAIQYAQRIDELISSLLFKESYIIKSKREAFRGVIGKLEALSPLSVLRRGYSITEKVDGNKILKTVKGLTKKDLIKTILAKGKIVSRVEEIEE